MTPMEPGGISGGGGGEVTIVLLVQMAFQSGKGDGDGRPAFKTDISSGCIFHHIKSSILNYYKNHLRKTSDNIVHNVVLLLGH